MKHNLQINPGREKNLPGFFLFFCRKKRKETTGKRFQNLERLQKKIRFSRQNKSVLLRNVTKYSYFVYNLEHIWFIFHSQKSIFTHQKSIIPLSSWKNGCYNTHTSNAAGKRIRCKIEVKNFHLRLRRPMIF